MDKFGERLQEERKRLGLNQTQFAAFGGVLLRAQVYYEKGERRPDVDYLMGISAAGVDVCYILTGVRSGAACASGGDGSIPGFPEVNAAMVLNVLKWTEQHLIAQGSSIRPGKAHDLIRVLCCALVEKERADKSSGVETSNVIRFNDFKKIIDLAS